MKQMRLKAGKIGVPSAQLSGTAEGGQKKPKQTNPKRRIAASKTTRDGISKLVFLNGKLVLEREAVVSVFDRGFLYGDGLFETMRVANGNPFRWKQHWHRLNCGAKFLGIRLTFSETELRKAADRLVAENALPESLLRLSVSRGVGPRGYSPKGADHPTTVISLHPAPKINPA